MKIVIAPQAFKGSLHATDVAVAIARGIRQVFPAAQLVLTPIADGGEGTVDALVRSTGGVFHEDRVMGPLGQPVNARWGVLGNGRSAVIEMAAASGLPLIPRDERNPLLTTTYGTGELVKCALDHGVTDMVIGIGGSATNDGGVGMAQALGVHFLDGEGRELPRGGASLAKLARIDMSGLDPRLRDVAVEVASDVNNPLCGPNGAASVYGPQKGATPEMVTELDAALARYAEVLRRDLGIDIKDMPGAGAAGGLGAGLVAFLHAALRPGVEIVFRALGIEQLLDGADLVITGEGRMDGQDIFGKAPVALAQRARRLGIPTIAIVGSTGRDYRVVYNHGIDAVIGTVNRPMAFDRALAESSRLVTEAAMRAGRMMRVGMKVGRRERRDGERRGRRG